MLDKKYSKLDTYLASTKHMGAASQPVQVVSRAATGSVCATEVETPLARQGELLALDPEVIATVKTSQEDIRYQRVFSHEEALRQLRRAAVLAP